MPTVGRLEVRRWIARTQSLALHPCGREEIHDLEEES